MNLVSVDYKTLRLMGRLQVLDLFIRSHIPTKLLCLSPEIMHALLVNLLYQPVVPHMRISIGQGRLGAKPSTPIMG